MSNAVTHRQKGEQTRAMIFGLLVIVLGGVLVYAFGFWRSQWDNFAPDTNYKTIIYNNSARYFSSLAASIVQVVVYLIFFFKIAGRSEQEYACVPIEGRKYIYAGWKLAGIIAAVCVGGIALVIHYFAFQRHFTLVGPLMWWIFVLQMLVSVSVYFFPFTKPLKKFGA